MKAQKEWFDIQGYENSYQINRKGDIRTLKSSPRCQKYDILKPQISKKTDMFIKLFGKMASRNLLEFTNLSP